MGNELDLHSNGYVRDNFVVSDNEGQDYEETDDEDYAFEPVKQASKPERSRKRQLGPPITTDEKLSRLDSLHRLIVDDFVYAAKSEMEKASFLRGGLYTWFTKLHRSLFRRD